MILTTLLVVAFLRCAGALVPVTPGMRSFGSVIKGGHLIGGIEKIVFEHNVTSDGSNGAVVQQWFAGPYISDRMHASDTILMERLNRPLI